MMSMTGSRPFASHFKYSFTTTEERTVLVPDGPTQVVLGEDVEPADSRYSSKSKEHYPHMEEAECEGREYKPVDAPNAEASRHIEKKTMEVKIQKTRYDAGSYELLLTLIREGELCHYGFETEGPNIESARSVVEFLSERVEVPYRKDGETRVKTFGPLVEAEPSESEMRAMQMLFNGHRKASSTGMDAERVMQIVEAVVERDMETLNGLVQDVMEPFMETETVKVPADDDEEGMVEVEQPMPEERERVKNKFALTLEGVTA
jgi:hypothetical protein